MSFTHFLHLGISILGIVLQYIVYNKHMNIDTEIKKKIEVILTEKNCLSLLNL